MESISSSLNLVGMGVDIPSVYGSYNVPGRGVVDPLGFALHGGGPNVYIRW